MAYLCIELRKIDIRDSWGFKLVAASLTNEIYGVL